MQRGQGVPEHGVPSGCRGLPRHTPARLVVHLASLALKLVLPFLQHLARRGIKTQRCEMDIETEVRHRNRKTQEKCKNRERRAGQKQNWS